MGDWGAKKRERKSIAKNRRAFHEYEILETFEAGLELTGTEVRSLRLTLVPVSMYFKENGLVKVELALARGKKTYDKRQAIAKRDAQREIDRAMKDRYR